MASEMRINADFPGGNIVVDSIEGDVVELRPDLRDTDGNWFYWCFAVSGAANRRLTFRFGEYSVLTTNGAAVSSDCGATWRWLGADCVSGNSFIYEFGDNAAEVRFCLAFPYLEENLNLFLAEYEGNEHLSVETFCISEQGREIELLNLGCLDAEPLAKVLITCRHHCCEMMANYVLEGMMRIVLDADSEFARYLRDDVEFMIIPFVDKDGVENGDQGKNRRPHDHNRDYGDTSIYNAVKAIKKRVLEWADGKLKVVLDLHCPYVNGDGNENIYLVGSASDPIWRGQQAFSDILERVATTGVDTLSFSSEYNIPFGEGWNAPGNFSKGKSFTKWIAETIPNVNLVTTIEIPYAKAGGIDVTPATASNFAASLAESISRSLLSGGHP